MDDDDIISVSPKFLVVSEAAPEREFIRRIVSDAPVAIEVMEVAAAGDVTATCEALACDPRIAGREGGEAMPPAG